MSKAQDYLKKLENGNTSSTPSSTTEKLSTSGYLRNLEKENMSPVNVRARERAVKIAGFTEQENARLAEESKFNIKRDVGGVLRNLPGAMKTVFTEPPALGKVASFLAPTITGTAGKIKRGEDVTARDIGGSALEAASYLIPGGAIAKGVGLGVKAGTLASKIAVPSAIGGVSGATFGAGQAVAGGEDLGGVAKEALKTGALGTVLGGAIGGALATRASAKLRGKTPEQYSAEALNRANLGPIPEAGIPPTHPTPISRVLGRGEVPPVEPGTIKISQVIENLKKTNVTAQQGEAILKELSQNNPTGNFTKAEIVKAFQNNIPPSTKGIFKNIRTETPSAKVVELTPVSSIKETPILQEGVPSGTKVAGEGKGTGEGVGGPSGEIPAFEASTEVAQKAQADAYLSAGKEDHVLAVAQGRVTDPSLNKSAAFKVLEEKYAGGVKAGEVGALEKLNELSKSGVISQAGQDLSFTGMGLGSEGPASLLSLARKIKEEVVTKSGRNIEKETESAFTEVSNKIKKGVDINKALSDFIDKITC